jgi:hypothetical protein
MCTHVSYGTICTSVVKEKIGGQRFKVAPQDPLAICKSVRGNQKTLKPSQVNS